MKSSKAEKSLVDAEVKIDLDLKKDHKQKHGKDWTPGTTTTQITVQPSTPPKTEEIPPAAEGMDDTLEKNNLVAKVTQQGEIVRDLKTKKSPKQEIDKAVKILLDLKAEYKALTGM